VTAWDTTTGRSDVLIAELDTGVPYDHPDLLKASQSGRLTRWPPESQPIVEVSCVGGCDR